MSAAAASVRNDSELLGGHQFKTIAPSTEENVTTPSQSPFNSDELCETCTTIFRKKESEMKSTLSQMLQRFLEEEKVSNEKKLKEEKAANEKRLQEEKATNERRLQEEKVANENKLQKLLSENEATDPKLTRLKKRNLQTREGCKQRKWQTKIGCRSCCQRMRRTNPKLTRLKKISRFLLQTRLCFSLVTSFCFEWENDINPKLLPITAMKLSKATMPKLQPNISKF